MNNSWSGVRGMPSQNKIRLYIKKIEIENCGRFYGKGHSLILSDSPEKNITIIAADSGIGKSTIHDLIYWGLYGKHKPTKEKSNKQVDYGIINNDALTSLKCGDSTSGSITISIYDDVGELYELKRTITRH